MGHSTTMWTKFYPILTTYPYSSGWLWIFWILTLITSLSVDFYSQPTYLPLLVIIVCECPFFYFITPAYYFFSYIPTLWLDSLWIHFFKAQLLCSFENLNLGNRKRSFCKREMLWMGLLGNQGQGLCIYGLLGLWVADNLKGTEINIKQYKSEGESY